MARRESQRAAAARRERSSSPISDGVKNPPMIFPRRKAGQNKRPAPQMPVVVTYEILCQVFEMPLWKACKHLGICATAMKKVCRKLGVMKWPYKENHMPGKRAGKPGSPGCSNGAHSEVASAPSTPPSSPPSAAPSSRRMPRSSRNGPSPGIVVRETSRRAAAAAAAARLSAVVAAERKDSWSSEASPSSPDEDEDQEEAAAQEMASSASTPVLHQAAAPLQLQVMPERHRPLATFSPRGYQHQALKALVAPLQQQALIVHQQHQQQAYYYEPPVYASSATAFEAFARVAPPPSFDPQGGAVNFDDLADDNFSASCTEEEWEFGSDAGSLFRNGESLGMEQDGDQLFSIMSF